MVVWGDLKIALNRREAKGKGEKERYIHLNAAFQKIARRDKKTFPSDQCKEIEENNGMGKTRDLFKKIRDTKGTFHAKMGKNDRNGTDLTKADDIKKRWQEYTEEIKKKKKKKIFMIQLIIMMWSPTQSQNPGMWSQVGLRKHHYKKVSGGDGITAELFQILKDDAVKVLHSICQQIWKTQQWPQTGKGQFSFQSQRKAMPKNAQTTAQLHSSHTLVK